MSDAARDLRVEEVVAAVLASSKYATVCVDTVRTNARAALRVTKSAKEAAKRVKRQLHQIGGAYQRQDMRYDAWLAELRGAPDDAAQRDVCQRIMQAHASSRERLPYLTAFYEHIFAKVGAVSSMLDIACGLNPLALPWMGLSPATRYDCLDIYSDQMAFLQAWLELRGQPGQASCQDVLLTTPECAYDVILLLKTVPCLQQLDAPATRELLAVLRAPTLVVSFPGRSLGGRDVGMLSNYRQGFEALLADLDLNGEGQVIGDELVYIVDTSKS